MNDIEIIDNYLPQQTFYHLQQLICYNLEFPFAIRDRINPTKIDEELYNWYAVHILYQEDVPISPYFNDVFNSLIVKIKEEERMKSLMRVKVNFYGNTENLIEHQKHIDYNFQHTAAIFSLNTCDGFTRIGDTKVDSVENRIVFFDGSLEHNSSSTSDSKGRFNININLI